MDKNILDTLNIGEHVVEIKKYMLHNEYVYQVTVYTCCKILFWKHIKKYTYPFYFASKNIAEEFIKYYDDFYVSIGSYWDSGDKICYMLNATHGLGEGKYWMIDDYKYRQDPHAIGKHFHLKDDGVWNGVVNTYAHFSTYYNYNINFKEILNRESVLSETDSTYIFKMVK